MDYFLTPNPNLILRSDGVVIPKDASTPQAKMPSAGDLQQALPLSAAHGLRALSSGGGQSDSWLLNALEVSGQTRGVMETAGNIADVAHTATDYYEMAEKALILMGALEDEHESIINRLHTIEAKLDVILRGLQDIKDDIYAGWLSNRKVQMDQLMGKAQGALDTVREFVTFRENPSDTLVLLKLHAALHDSKSCLDELMGPSEGFWQRPYRPQAINLQEWEKKTDDRTPVMEGLVWDPRLALPIFSFALTVRILVLKIVYRDHPRSRYCPELTKYVRFLLMIQDRMHQGLRRKLQISHGETGLPYDFVLNWTMIPFYAGAVDVYTGLQDFIHVDRDAFNLSVARGFIKADSVPNLQLLDPALVANTITFDDIDQRFQTKYRPILEKQSAVAFTRLRIITGLHELCIMTKRIGEICSARPSPWATFDSKVYELHTSLQGAAGKVVGGSSGSGQSTLRLVRELNNLVYEGSEQSGPEAMISFYHLYREFVSPDSELLNQLKAQVRRVKGPQPPHTMSE